MLLTPPQVLHPAITLKNAEVALNFGATPLAFPPPPGYIPLAQAPAAWVAAGGGAAAASAGGGGNGRGEKDLGRKPVCLILEPAKDLAEQTANCFNDYGKHLKAPEVKTGLFVGGMDAAPQVGVRREGEGPGRAVHMWSNTPTGLRGPRWPDCKALLYSPHVHETNCDQYPRSPWAPPDSDAA